jgi:5-methyltetrahydrofolate--homocysteine methyltransferase
MSAFLGKASVYVDDRTVWFSPVEVGDVADLHLEYRADNPWWRRVLGLTKAAAERWKGAACVGFSDIGGNLDILAGMRGTEQLLMDLMDAPAEVERLIGEITRLWLRYYDELAKAVEPAGRGTTPWAPIWSPGRCYMLQSDFAYMISPAMFERFVLPDLAACCDAMDHGFYHLDGKGQIPHLDMLLSLKRLRGIQWIPGDGSPPPEKWLPLLKRIRDAGKLCQLFVTPDGARKIARELGGKGFAFQIHQWSPKSHQEVEELVRELTGPRGK